jgi:hypothetical protein
MSTLARVVDPEAVAALDGPSVRLAVRVPASWSGRVVEVRAPTRLSCARCDGGGCDRCARSGAFKIELGEAERSFIVTLPERLAADGALVRLLRPLGDGSVIETLLLEIRADDQPSEGVSLHATPSAAARAGIPPVLVVLALVLTALAIALAAR